METADLPRAVVITSIGAAAWVENAHPPGGISAGLLLSAEVLAHVGSGRWYGGLVGRFETGAVSQKSTDDIPLKRGALMLEAAYLLGDDTLHGPKVAAGAYATYFDFAVDTKRYIGSIVEASYCVFSRSNHLFAAGGLQLGLGSPDDGAVPNGGAFASFGFTF